jgi:trans-2,3-dihydro-3-hydroxyanthranilate isomerase
MRMPELRFLHYDVFTDRRFEGNQLAVFTDGRGIDDRTMQRLAAEMNFSESTFLLPAERPDTDVRMRIFTPGGELPMAGHPTVGSTFALARSGVIAAGREQFVFGLNVGPTRVELEWTGGELSFAWMDQKLPEIKAPLAAPEDLTRAVGIDHAAHAATNLPIEEISCGNPFIFVPIASRAAIDAAEPDGGALRRLESAFGRPVGVFVFTTDGGTGGVTLYSRMFAPGVGIIEDPATGSASGPVGCYLVRHGLVARDRADRIVSLQGVAMGRPSYIHIKIGTGAGGEITRVQVGGRSVLAGEGVMYL